jgi:hypothetical protein
MYGERKKLETKNWKLETNFGKRDSPFTPVHEWVHVFGIDYHANRAVSVMYRGGLSTNNTITATKRLTPDEINTIRESELLK